MTIDHHRHDIAVERGDRPRWHRGWKRRVFISGVLCMIVGGVVGSNTDLQASAGMGNRLPLLLLLVGWFGGAVSWLAVERRKARIH